MKINVLKNEIFADVIGNSNYMISNYGRVISKGRIVKAGKGIEYWREESLLNKSINNVGYEYIKIPLNGKRRTNITIHRLVADAFVPNPQGHNVVNHINENKLDNRAENLEWCTYQENNTHLDCHRREERRKKRSESLKKAWEEPGLRQLKREQTKKLWDKGVYDNVKRKSRKGLPFTGDRIKLSESLKAHFQKSSPHNKIPTKVIQLSLKGDVIKIWESHYDACMTIDKCEPKRIIETCEGKRVMHKGFKWKYYENKRKRNSIDKKT